MQIASMRIAAAAANNVGRDSELSRVEVDPSSEDEEDEDDTG